MKILGIETSCDETGAAVIEAFPHKKYVKVLANIISSSLFLHKKTGGIIPEIAAREQIKYIIPVIQETIEQCNNSTIDDIDAIAVTVGPGLIGSLLVGVETAKTLSFLFRKPIIPVNHLYGHIYANFVYEAQKTKNEKQIEFPAVALVVSGGHTDLVLMKGHGNLKWLGGTRDDAAGEAFDKIGRLLNLPYPGGPSIEKVSLDGDPKAFKFPRPLIDSGDFDFSFSGLKTAVFSKFKTMKKLDDQIIADISASVQQAVIDVLVEKTINAAREYKVKSILLGGGVAANQKLRDEFKSSIVNSQSSIKLFVPPKRLCTDNAAMIAMAGFFNHKSVDWQKISADPELYFD
ncbi:MAG: tRNA (adenosine(37)-N6)-threonylcarbamoyltransferase complex transferase subunit TsaD [Candidatus Levybacteria bacterium]|nr:tRNA (adenosine(37)-N6)-threonylcarbamoyltransferase complex transferase subunit TsaD [Candidatus Levybacteria bacterium]